VPPLRAWAIQVPAAWGQVVNDTIIMELAAANRHCAAIARFAYNGRGFHP
jgi:hypothetical protein